MQQYVKVVCAGTKRLMMDSMSEETMDGLNIKANRKVKRTDISLEDEAEAKLYLTEEGVIAFPGDNFFACIVKAGEQEKWGGKQMTTEDGSMIPGFLDVIEEFLPLKYSKWETDRHMGVSMDPPEGATELVDFDDEHPSWVPDKRKGNNRSGKTVKAVRVVRPLFNRWGFEATISFNDMYIKADKVRVLVEKAGIFCGLGAHRKKGRFGRFKIVGWQVVDEQGQPVVEEKETKKKIGKKIGKVA